VQLERLPVVAFDIRSRSSTVAQVIEGRIRGLGSGRTSLHVELGSLSRDILVRVGENDDAPFAASLRSISIGAGGGFGRDRLPGVVLGPPYGGGRTTGSTDTLSLGTGGSIELGFGNLVVYDGPGPDLIVFENPFRYGGDLIFAEPAQVMLGFG